ncbi:PLDc N-terminal domain-containing protein [Hoyosella subflava]|uniref:Cardiolipin synthase N-terminal domain-containing protein n=1 Tax=Hoyosella subflava (strain DSM 45089 / JCM 17490 / NBRC 109087 / DQS3-9A1) TaxID=443218 RepID=F6EPV4_HOYSD|nr:PLDc N-terminal domain-containing protein [Hoyosella subflava]AEF40583.1 hypothetical protein AS9A_2134 [Hoyosella subflava DQS3-9A1]
MITWKDMTPAQRGVLLGAASIQLSLAVSAWADLASRPAGEVNGSKAKWAGIIAINFVGPIAYFARGRKR